MKKTVSEMSIREMIGHKLMIGLPGETLDNNTRETIMEYGVSNFILFKRNIKSLEGLKVLCRDIQRLVMDTTGLPAIIGVDEEGGCVNRLTNDAMIMPAPMGVAATNQVENAARLATLSARQLRSLGINMSFVPDADINSNPCNPIIGGRSYGDNPEQVTDYVLGVAQAYRQENFLISAKHFPGHGDTDLDSHLALPLIDKTYEELDEFELLPFKALIKDNVPAIMTSHILFPKIEKDEVPGTMSKAIITDVLRGKLGYKGLIVSDCMEMDAIKKYYGTPFGCKKAAIAGVDIMLVSHTPSLQREASRQIEQALASGEYTKEELMDSVSRIIRYKEKYCTDKKVEFDSLSAKAVAYAIRKKTFTLLDGNVPPLGTSPIFIGCKDFRSANVSDEEDKKTALCDYLCQKLGGEALVTSKDPSKEEIEKACLLASTHSAIIVNTFNAHIFKGQARLVNALGKLKIPILAISLRDPYDFNYINSAIPGLCAWDYTPMNMEALLPIIAGHDAPQGKLPIRLDRTFFTIRPFEKTDSKGVSDTIANTYRVSNAKDYSKEYIENDLAGLKPEDILKLSETVHFYVACQGERVIACAGIKPLNGSESESILTAVFVLPEFQGFSIGRELIANIEKDEYFTRAKRVEVPASITAYRFYKKLGFTHKGNIEKPDETNRYPMEKFNI